MGEVFFPWLGTLADAQNERRSVKKGPSRSEENHKFDVAEKLAEIEWKKKIWKRDDNTCRCCGRTCKKGGPLRPERGECHHVEGRYPVAIRWDRRNGILLCQQCHEQVTGAVNVKVVLVATKTYTIDGRSFKNADKKVRFERVA